MNVQRVLDGITVQHQLDELIKASKLLSEYGNSEAKWVAENEKLIQEEFAKVKESKQRELELRRKEATQKISALVKQAHALISEAEDIADTYNVSFSFDLAYGMGGTYRPKGGDADDWDESNCWDASDEGGWVSSSSMC